LTFVFLSYFISPVLSCFFLFFRKWREGNQRDDGVVDLAFKKLADNRWMDDLMDRKGLVDDKHRYGLIVG